MMKKWRFYFLFAILFILISVLPFAQKTETIDGVRVVHNGKTGAWGKKPEVSLEYIKTIGDIESDKDETLFYMPSDVAFDPEGNIYVLDSGNHRIQKFSPDGMFLKTIGNKGQGPGEFSHPLSIDIDDKGLIYVSDPMNQRIQILNPDGTEVKTIQVVKGEIGSVRVKGAERLLMGGGGGFLSLGMGGPDEKQEPSKVLKILDWEGEVHKEFCDKLDYKNFLMNRQGNKFHYSIDGAGNVYVVFDYQNRIEKYNRDGMLEWRADRKLNFDTTKPKNKGKYEARGGRVRVEMPQMNRCSTGIAADEKGRVWVLTLKRQIKDDEAVQTEIRASMGPGGRSMAMSVTGNTEVREADIYELEIFGPDGALLGKIPLNHFADDIRIHGDHVFILERMRGMQVFEYKIVE